MRKPKLYPTHRDSKNVTGVSLDERSGEVYLHASSGVLYSVTGSSWDAGRDRWLINYREIYLSNGCLTGVEFSHLPEDFDQTGRFIQVEGKFGHDED